MVKFAPTPLRALKGPKRGPKSLQIGGQIGLQMERDGVMIISGIVDLSGLGSKFVLK